MRRIFPSLGVVVCGGMCAPQLGGARLDFWSVRVMMRANDRSEFVAIMAEKEGWHCHELRSSLASLGYGTVAVNLAACEFAPMDGAACSAAGLSVPGFENVLPEGVFVRGIPAGNLETVVFYLDVLHALQENGICVYNNASMIERAVDKARTSFLLQSRGVPTVRSWSLLSSEKAAAICDASIQKGGKMVIKPMFGSQGNGLYLVDTENPFPDYFSAETVFYMQEFIEPVEGCWQDIRVLVIGKEYMFAMRRIGSSWISNVAQGADIAALKLDARLSELALAATRALGLHYAGVDIIPCKEGEYLVTEVNSVPAWKGLQSITRQRISDCIAKDFIRNIRNSQPLQAGG